MHTYFPALQNEVVIMVISYTQQNSTSRNLDISKIKLKTTDKSLQLAP